jgi:hypothetical protein
VLLLDNLNDTACSRFDQDRATIDYRVAILTDAILWRHIVICNALFRENRSNSQIFAILVRGAPLFDDIGMKARTLIDTKDPSYAADNAAYDATHNRADGACRSFTIPCTPLDTSRNPLGLGRNREEDRDSNSGGSDRTGDHDSSFGGDWRGATIKPPIRSYG